MHIRGSNVPWLVAFSDVRGWVYRGYVNADLNLLPKNHIKLGPVLLFYDRYNGRVKSVEHLRGPL